jgi:hypothetical protein
MSTILNLHARFVGARPGERNDSPGVALEFEIERPRPDLARVEDFAALGPPGAVAAVSGMGRVRRLLRAARIALPRAPAETLASPETMSALLARAAGTRVVLSLRPRSTFAFVVWTESGIETVPDVIQVLDDEEAWLVLRHGRPPVRVARRHVVRHRLECQRWWEVLSLEAAAPRSPAQAARTAARARTRAERGC